MKTKKIIVFLLIIFIFQILSSCSINNSHNNELEFIKQIENLPATMRSSYIQVFNMHELIETTKPNFIIKGKIISRGESDVIDPFFNKYTKEDLYSDDLETARTAYGLIGTPYEIEITDIYHGNINKIGDIIPFNAPYGIIDDFGKRKEDHPILEVGEEYILFLRGDSLWGVLTYYLSFKLAGALKLDNENGIFSLYNDSYMFIFSKYECNTEKLLDDLKELIKNNNYTTEIEYAGKIE